MGDSAVQNKYFFHTAANGVDAAFDLGDHTSRDHTLAVQLCRVPDVDHGNQRGGIVLITENTRDIRHRNEGFRVHGTRDLGSRRVGVDIVNVALHIATDGGYDGDIALFQKIRDRFHVDLRDLADVAKAFVLHFRFDQMTVHTGNTHRLAAVDLKKIDEGLIDLSRKDHLNDLYGFLIRHAESVDEFGLLADFFQHIRNFGTAAVNEHDLYADQREEHDVLHDLHFSFFVDHRVAAVFDNDDLIIIILYIRQRLRQDFCALCIGNIHWYHFDSPPIRFTCDSRR